MSIWKKLKYLLPSYRRAQEEDVREELASLAAMAGPNELGNLTRAAEDAREVWLWTPVEQVYRDLQYATRTLRRNPGFTVAAVLSLALGIGANTAIFSMFDALMLRWLPVHNPQELLQLSIEGPMESLSYPIVRALEQEHEIFDGLGGFSGWRFDAGVGSTIRNVHGAVVSGGFYEMLGLNPVAGRLLTPEDDQPGAPLVAVITYDYWAQEFQRNPAAIGQTLHLNGVPVTIAGVSPPGFVGANVGDVAQITVPVAAIPRLAPESAALLGAGNFWLRILTRPKAGLSTSEVAARFAVRWPAIAGQLVRADWPVDRKKSLIEAKFQLKPGGTGWTYLRAIYSKPLVVLMGVVLVLLLITCANVANLLLARAAARQAEVAVRLAMGASRGRVVRQLLTESTLLALAGAVFAVALAFLSSRLLLNTVSGGLMQIQFDMTPNWHVLGFTGATAMVTGMLFGLAPALQTTKAPSLGLKEDARMSHSRSRWLSGLVSVQVALSLLLVIGAGLFIRTLQNVESVDLGFRREGVLLVTLEGRRTAVAGELLRDLARVSGVVSASMSTHTPLNGSTWSEPAVPKGEAMPKRDNAFFVGAAPGFFETMQTTLIAGRTFDEHDTTNSPQIAIVNQAYVERYFPKQNALGAQLTASVRGKHRDLQIVGVVKNARLAGFRKPSPPTVYVPYAQLTGDFPTTLEIRTTGPLARVSDEVHRTLQARLPNLPIEVRPLTAQVKDSMVQERMMATLAGAFGVLALLLSCVGLYGLISYGVARRTREMGIRMALGAQRGSLIVMVVKDAARLVLIGTIVGLPAAWFASRWMKAMLFGLQPTDPATFAGAVLTLAVAGLLAAYLPARQASQIDPMTALRHE